MNPNLPPGPEFRFPIMLYLKATQNPLGFMENMVKQYGDLVHYQLGSRHDYLINDPDAIQKVLLAPEEVMARSTPPPLKRVLGNGLLISQGNFHRKQRRLIQPSFARQRIAEMVPDMLVCTRKAIEGWRPGSVMDISEEMKRLTMDIVVTTIFGADFSDEHRELADAIDTMQNMTNKNELPLIGDFFRNWPFPSNLKFKKDLAFLNKRIGALIEERRKSDLTRPDLLSMLLRLQATPEGKETLSDQQVRDEAMTFFVAGHETVSHALSWTWYLLSRDQESQRKMAEECEIQLGEDDPTEEKLSKMFYARKVFAESMRLYPPVWVIGRRPVVDFEIGGYMLPKGAHLYLSPYLVQRDARYYPDPDRFDPERWNPELMSSRPRFSYFPFGGGSRLCIGEGFAWTEAMVVMTEILKRWKIQPVAEHAVEMETCVTLRPKYGIRVRLEEKKTNTGANAPVQSRSDNVRCRD